MRPWNRECLWAAVLTAQMAVRPRREREAVAEARGALQTLDAIERHFMRRDDEAARKRTPGEASK